MKVKIIVVIVVLLLIVLAVLLFIGRKINVKTDKNVNGLSEELQEVFYLASLSPSSHNIQSWLVNVYTDENRIEIQIDPERKLSVVDPTGREMYISLGCYIETMTQAFRAYGYDTTSQFNADEKKMVVTYEKVSDTVDQEIINLITTRHTDKSPFYKDKLVVSSTLESAISHSAANITYYPIGTPEYDIIKSSTMTAYKKQAYDEAAAKELSTWLRLSNGETMIYKDGLPAEQLGITGIKKSLYYVFTNHDSATGETFAKQGMDSTEKQLEGCNTFVIIASANDEESLINCGRATVSFWLEMVDVGVSVHPMSYALEDSEIKSDMISTINLKEEPQMILRVGYVSDYGENAAIRRDLAEYINVH